MKARVLYSNEVQGWIRSRWGTYWLIASFILAWQYSSTCQAEEDPYAALREVLSITSRNISAMDCSVSIVADFERYPPHLPLFREAWLNKDFSIDFYNQRRKQVFLFVVLKRGAELITEGLYTNASAAPVHECVFKIDIRSFDKFGQPRVYPAVSWRFNRAQADKVAWDTLDPRNFQEIAIDYKTTSDMDDWVSGEPNMASNNNSKASVSVSSCDERFLRANAIFIRATTFCKRDYMDTRAGNYALAMFKQCMTLGEAELRPKIEAAMGELDRMVSQKGRSFGCRWVDEVEQSVVKSIPR